MDEQSYDGTEQTPQPKSFRPPPMHTIPLMTTKTATYPRSSASAASTFSGWSATLLSSRRLGHEASGILHRNSSFESSSSSSLYHIHGTAPSVEPPSPLSRPAGSFLDVDGAPAAPTDTRWSSLNPPPISEVRVESDSFFDCVGRDNAHDNNNNNNNEFDDVDDDDDLLERTERSLRLPLPKNIRTTPTTTTSSTTSTARNPSWHLYNHPRLLALDDASVAVSMTSLYETHPPSPSPLEVSRVHETALQALLRLKQELLKSQARNELLMQEQQGLAKQWEGQQSSWKSQLERLETSLHSALNAKRELEEQVATFKEEQQTWEERLSSVAREKKESLHRRLTNDNRVKELKQSLEATKKELTETKHRHAQLEQEFSTVAQEKAEVEQENSRLKTQLKNLSNDQTAKETASRLHNELKAKEQEVAQWTTTVSQLKESHLKETDQWKAQVKEQQAALEELKAQKATPRTANTVRFQESEPPLDASVADRLARMRDSAERAHLIKGHKRELARLKMEHEHHCQKLQDSHQEALRNVHEESRLSFQSQLEELKRSLKLENEDHLQKIRGEQREKFVEMQNEFMRQQDQADQALQKALAKISNLTQQYEREVSHRAGMELKNAQLKNQLDDQKKDLQERYAKELQAQKTEWEFERETLLTMIQRDCNTAFENHRHAPPSHHSTPHSHQENSPKDVNFDFDPPRSETKLTVDTATESDSRTFWVQTSTNLVSPAYSEIDEVLRETEALIRSIV